MFPRETKLDERNVFKYLGLREKRLRVPRTARTTCYYFNLTMCNHRRVLYIHTIAGRSTFFLKRLPTFDGAP